MYSGFAGILSGAVAGRFDLPEAVEGSDLELASSLGERFPCDHRIVWGGIEANSANLVAVEY